MLNPISAVLQEKFITVSINTQNLYTKKKNKFYFNKMNLAKSGNDLEIFVLKKYPKIKNLKEFLLTLPKTNFVRMTGSGSAIVAYFNSKKAVYAAARIFRRKYKNYWYIISKTI